MARIAFGGFEVPSFQADDIVRTSTAGTNLTYTSTANRVHKDAAGNGGTYALWGDQTAGGATVAFRQVGAAYTPTEAWYRFTTFILGESTIGGEGDGARLLLTQGAATQIEIRLRAIPNATIQIYRGLSGTLIATSIGGLFPFDRYFLCEVHARIATSGGFIRIYIDDPGTYVTPAFSFSGDTQALLTPGVNSIGWGGRAIAYHDDWAINALTLATLTPSAAFVAGDIITGGTSGASATVTLQRPLDVLVLELWNSVSFQAGETITGSISGSTATVFAPSADYQFGFEPQSWGPQEGFTVALRPTGAGASNTWGNSTGAAASTNWTFVDENPPNTTDFIQTTSLGALDLYTHGSLPVTAFNIKGVSNYVYGNRDGSGVAQYYGMLRIGSTNYANPRIDTLPTSFGAVFSNWVVSPDTLAPFTPSEVNLMQYGVKT